MGDCPHGSETDINEEWRNLWLLSLQGLDSDDGYATRQAQRQGRSRLRLISLTISGSAILPIKVPRSDDERQTHTSPRSESSRQVGIRYCERRRRRYDQRKQASS